MPDADGSRALCQRLLSRSALYSLQVDPEGLARVRLEFPIGRPLAELLLLSSVHCVGATDEITSVEPVEARALDDATLDGRLPLAIASYNGGPHNVRRWMREYAATMPLDAFLEFIPFDQTHRYVRRVLGHYAAYREQENLPMERLTLVLPDPAPDTVGF